jgi:hypothetical protein
VDRASGFRVTRRLYPRSPLQGAVGVDRCRALPPRVVPPSPRACGGSGRVVLGLVCVFALPAAQGHELATPKATARENGIGNLPRKTRVTSG